MDYTRQVLSERHRLSHQQIDKWFKVNSGSLYLQEKMSLLVSVKNFLYVTDLLRENKISFMCIKGPLLSYKLYGDAAVRFSHDIDLVINFDELDFIIELLKKAGFTISDGMEWPKEDMRRRLLRKCLHHTSLYSKSLHFCVELHWTILNEVPIKQEKLAAIVVSNQTNMYFADRNFIVLNNELELLYLMIHGAKHGWSRLKWLVDINEYPMENINTSLFMQLVHQLHAEKIVIQTNELLLKYFGKEISFAPKGSIPNILISYPQTFINKKDITTLNVSEIWRNAVYVASLFPNISYKIRRIRNLFIRQNDILDRDFSTAAMYYIYRPYSFFKRRILHVK